MDFAQFQHVIRAAAGITHETVFVVVGSQAVLAQYRNPPAAMVASMELDLYPKFRPDLADEIDVLIGAGSQFQGTYGYHADGVAPETSKLPRNWETRAITVPASADTGNATAICPEIHDLAASKLVAGREKDLDWITAAMDAGLVHADVLKERLAETAVDDKIRELAERRIARLHMRERRK
jgi:hypothetical protein